MSPTAQQEPRPNPQPQAPAPPPLHPVPCWHEESSVAPLPFISPCGGALHGPRPPTTKMCRAGGKVSCAQVLLAPHSCGSCQPPPPYSCRCRCMNGGVSQGKLKVWCPLTTCRESVSEQGGKTACQTSLVTQCISLLYTLPRRPQTLPPFQ